MRQRKGPPLVPTGGHSVLFGCAEEAWFWYVRCQKARDDGARFVKSGNATVRPCDPDDIYRAVRRLAERRILTRHHIRVLTIYGVDERPPDPRCQEEERPFQVWQEAMLRLGEDLKAKDIIE